ncbi:transcriptional repressor NrdR [candidate division KSB1 bacterium]|nr:transcriptional repressor NrdR [candidate division KSB1 bacterium]
MRCPFCGIDQDRVVDTRSREDGRVIRRRRLCENCERRFITVEEIENKSLTIIKSDNRREGFDRGKLLRGVQISCIKRPVSIEQIEKLVENVKVELESEFVKEVPSRRVGELVIQFLRELDEVAYVRFASVYRNFKDKEEFVHELNQLEKTPDPE